MENAIQKYGSYEVFEEETGGKILQRPNIMSMIQRYLKREDMENEIFINLSEELLSRGSMTRVKGKPMLNVRIINLRELWVEGLLRHEIGNPFSYLKILSTTYLGQHMRFCYLSFALCAYKAANKRVINAHASIEV